MEHKVHIYYVCTLCTRRTKERERWWRKLRERWITITTSLNEIFTAGKQGGYVKTTWTFFTPPRTYAMGSQRDVVYLGCDQYHPRTCSIWAQTRREGFAGCQPIGGSIKGILRGVRCTKSLRVLFLHRRPPSWTTLVLYSRSVFIFKGAVPRRLYFPALQ